MMGRILLTGGKGMVGQNILEHPLAKQWEICAPSSQELDLTNFSQAAKFIEKIRPDLIIHSAGKVGGIQANIAEPVRFLIDNLDMGRNVVLAAKACGVTRLINLGSSCMYPRNGRNPLTEDQVLQGELEPTNEGYALSKVVTARLCAYIRSETPQYDYKTLIPCNLYGRHDKFDPEHSHLIPAIIHKVHTAKIRGLPTVEIWGDGTARREFMYAGDLADAVLHMADDYHAVPTEMNVGLGYDHTINDYYRVVAKVIGWEGTFVHDLSKPVGMKQKLVSVERSEAWGWKAKTSLEAGIASAYDYYQKEYLK